MTNGNCLEVEDDSVEEWLGYFVRAFIGALNWQTGNRKQPMYPHAMWNKNREVMSVDATTTNAGEGYNGASSLEQHNLDPDQTPEEAGELEHDQAEVCGNGEGEQCLNCF